MDAWCVHNNAMCKLDCSDGCKAWEQHKREMTTEPPAPKRDDQQNALQSNVPKDCDCVDARRYRWLREHMLSIGGLTHPTERELLLTLEQQSPECVEWMGPMLDSFIRHHAALASEARDSTPRNLPDAASGRDDGSRAREVLQRIVDSEPLRKVLDRADEAAHHSYPDCNCEVCAAKDLIDLARVRFHAMSAVEG